MKRAITTLFTATLLILASCYESPFSSYPVHFVFDSTVSPYNQALTPGQYICVRSGSNIGQYRLIDALGKEYTMNIPQIQMHNPFLYGLGGLIIGTPNACDNNLWAFDWACPNCDRARHRIEIDRVMGHATCPNCGVKFDLNSGGIAIEGASRPLWQYKIFGAPNSLVIQN